MSSPKPTTRREGQDDILAEALAAGWSYPRAGKAAGVAAKTVQRRMREPEFAKLVTERRAERVTEVAGLMTEASIEAAAVLRDCLREEKGRDRLRAAQLILAMTGSFNQSENLSVRMVEIEARLNEGVTEPVVVDP